jgi:hypothetical protein
MFANSLRIDSSDVMRQLAQDNMVADRKDIDYVPESRQSEFPYLFSEQ